MKSALFSPPFALHVLPTAAFVISYILYNVHQKKSTTYVANDCNVVAFPHYIHSSWASPNCGYSNILHLFSSSQISDNIWQPKRIVGNIVVLQILIFNFFENSLSEFITKYLNSYLMYSLIWNKLIYDMSYFIIGVNFISVFHVARAVWIFPID